MFKINLIIISIFFSFNTFAINSSELIDISGNPNYDINNASDREIIINAKIQSGEVIDERVLNLIIEALNKKISTKE